MGKVGKRKESQEPDLLLDTELTRKAALDF